MSDQQPAASVVVPSYRGAHRLPALLDALAAQECDEPWEVVVVLDGIHDDSPAVLDRYADVLDLTVVESPAPHGTCVALNTGYAAARGRVLIRCDDDLTPGPLMVARHLEHHRGRDDVGVMGTTRDVFPDTPYARVYGRPANERAVAATYARPPQDRWLHWAAHNSLTRRTWDAVGGFDPRFVYGQDFELGVRLGRAGLTLLVDPQLELPHRGPSVSATTRVPRAFVSGASRRLAESVHGPLTVTATEPAGWKGRLWGGAVALLARTVRTRDGFARLGRAADAAITRLPAPAAGRLVALLVEAAGASGRRHGADDLLVYTAQKESELARESRAA